MTHGVNYQNSVALGIDYEGCHAWLTDSRVRAETEVLIVPAQDGVFYMNCYQAVIVKNCTDHKCRICREGDKIIGHILTGCEAHLWSVIKETRSGCVAISIGSCQESGTNDIRLMGVVCSSLVGCGCVGG